jgi:methyltransferase family protein
MTPAQEEPVAETEAGYPTVDLKDFDFVDFGCSAGGSIDWARKRFAGRRGLGVDLSEAKVAAARAAGHDAVQADAARIGQFDGKVRFATMIHFLEHLPSIDAARKVTATALSISRDFLYVRQPWFDSDGGLMREGLKLYWSHWRGHPLPMTSLQAYVLFDALVAARKCARFAIYGRGPIGSSDHSAVVPLRAPGEGHQYDPARDGPKPSIEFEGVFAELVVVAAPRHAERIAEGAAGDRLELLYDSAG